MEHFQHAKDLVIHVKDSLNQIEEKYQVALAQEEVSSSLLIDVKSVMEHLRSALEYCTQGLFDKYGQSKKARPHLYFPYANLKVSKVEFQRKKVIEKAIPGIESRPDIIKLIESYQHFDSNENKWFPKFMELNNSNKHVKLTPQKKIQRDLLAIKSGGVEMILPYGLTIVSQEGASIKIGNAIIPGGQTFNAENPPEIIGEGHSEIQTWAGFIFSDTKIEVLPFIKNATTKIDKMVDELSNI